MKKTLLNLHGVWVSVSAECPSLAGHLRHDFHYFLASRLPRGARPFAIRQYRGTAAVAAWGRGWKVGRARFYRAPAGERRLCYFERAWVDYRFHGGGADVYCGDPECAYEVVQSVVLAYAGEALDRRGVHRVHGLGIAFGAEGALILAPSGTGKSTLAAQMLGKPGPSLLSDDVPFVDAEGRLHPFPQRIALRERPRGLPARRFRRQRYGEKYVVGAEAFRDRVGAGGARTRWVLVAERGRESAVEPVARWRLLWPLLRWLVVGHETPQMWELFLRGTREDVAAKSRILLGRGRTAWGLLRRGRAGRLRLSPDGGRNVACLGRLPEVLS